MKLRLKLSARGRKLAGEVKRLRAALTLTACLGAGKPKSIARKIIVRSPKIKRLEVGEKGARKLPSEPNKS